jgi:hypothetical protein
MKLQHILMADVINSRKLMGTTVAEKLKMIVKDTNRLFKENILSPLTVTLGDEFQGVVDSPETAIKIIISIEEQIIATNCPFKLRYAFHSGVIETKLNNKIAHGMIGKGLTDTRAILNYVKKDEERFFIFSTEKFNFLNNLFILYRSFVDKWKQKDYKTISLFLADNDYKKIAGINKTTASAMWKKRKALSVKEYNTVKQLILDYVSGNI